MAGLVNSEKNKILNRYLRGDPGSVRPASVNVLLFTTLPDADGASGVEPTMSGYARVAVTQVDGSWSDPSTGTEGETDNAALIDFSDMGTGGTERVIGIGIASHISTAFATVGLWFGALANAWQGFSAAASDEELHCIGHGYSVDDRVFVRGANLPTGIDDRTEYYVGTVVSADVITLSTTAANANPVALTADGWGEISASNGRDVEDNDEVRINANEFDVAFIG